MADDATVSSGAPARVRWGVLAARVGATVLLVLGALFVTAFVGFFHSWHMTAATIVCPEPGVVFPGVDIAEVRESVTWNEGSWCTYLAPDGQQVGREIGPAAWSERNVFEPRFSFGVSAVVIAAAWLTAIALIRFVWTLGRIVRRPRPVPPIPVAV